MMPRTPCYDDRTPPVGGPWGPGARGELPSSPELRHAHVQNFLSERTFPSDQALSALRHRRRLNPLPEPRRNCLALWARHGVCTCARWLPSTALPPTPPA